MMMGGTASQDGNLAQLSKVRKEKPPIKRKYFFNSDSLFRNGFILITQNKDDLSLLSSNSI